MAVCLRLRPSVRLSHTTEALIPRMNKETYIFYKKESCFSFIFIMVHHSSFFLIITTQHFWQKYTQPFLFLKILWSSNLGSIALRKNRLCHKCDIKLNQMVRLLSWSLGNIDNLFMNITLRSPLIWLVVSVRVSSVGQIELFNHLLRFIILICYLKCVQIVLFRM